MAAPDHFGFRLTAGSRMDQPDALVKRQVCPYDGHAAGVADIHGDGVRAFVRSACSHSTRSFTREMMRLWLLSLSHRSCNATAAGLVAIR